jgi:hypothetical protein
MKKCPSCGAVLDRPPDFDSMSVQEFIAYRNNTEMEAARKKAEENRPPEPEPMPPIGHSCEGVQGIAPFGIFGILGI